MALLAIEGKQFDVAEDALKRLLKTGKKLDDAHYYLGSIAEFRKKYDEAIAHFSKIENGERQIQAHFSIVSLLSRKGDPEGARDFLHQLKPTSDDLSVRIVLAEIEVLNEAKQYQEAMNIVNTGLKKHPKNNDLYYARSLLAEKLGDMKMAEQDLKNVLASEPDNAHALNALGYMLADKTRRYEEALGYIERALKKNPNEPAFIDSMGWIQYRMGNLKAAVSYLRKAFKLFKDSEIAAHLGEVLWMMGERPEAKEIWDRALKDDPGSVHLLDVMKRFLQ
jgi:tetratricopeptide (TPR) repeat protein